MKKFLAAAVGLLALGAVAASANAAPLSGANGLATVKTETSNVIQVHGVHSSCRRDRRGWHRSPHGHRRSCARRRHYHGHHHHRARKHHHRRHHHHHRRHHRH